MKPSTGPATADDLLWTARRSGELLGHMLLGLGISSDDGLRGKVSRLCREASVGWDLPPALVEAAIRNYLSGMDAGSRDRGPGGD